MRPVRTPPLRTCVACHTGREQRALLRVVRSPSGEIRVDDAGRSNGRGAYVCRDERCIDIAIRRGALARALAATIPSGLAADLQRGLPAPKRSPHDPMTVGGSFGQE